MTPHDLFRPVWSALSKIGAAMSQSFFFRALTGRHEPRPADTGLESRVASLETAIARNHRRIDHIMATIDDLKAAVAADEATDAKLVAYLGELKTSIEGLNQKLTAALARPTLDPAELQTVVDGLNAHVAEIAAQLPPEPAPAPDAPAA